MTVAAAAVLACLLFAVLTANARLRRVALVIAGTAAIWVLAALAISTPTERAQARTRAMVLAYDSANWQQLSELIDEETRFAGFLKGQEIVEAAKLTHEDLGHTGRVRIRGFETTRDKVGVLVFVQIGIDGTDQFTYRGLTSWKFDYRQRGDEWRLERIEPVADQIEPSVIMRNVRLPPDVAGRQP